MRIQLTFLLVATCCLLSLSPPRARCKEASVSIGGVIRGWGTHQGYLYVAQRDSIIILDARDGEKIHEVARYKNTDGPLENMILRWPAIYFLYHRPGSYYHRMGSIDVTDPARPRQLKFFDNFAEKNLDFFTSGSLLLFNSRGIHRYDISNPLHPIMLNLTDDDFSVTSPPPKPLPPACMPPGEVLYAGNIHNVTVIGKRAYVDDGEPVLKIFAVSDPLKPKYLGSAKDTDKIKSQMSSKKTDGESNRTLNRKYQVSTDYKEYDANSTETLDYNHLLIIRDVTSPGAPKTVATVKKWLGSGNGMENVDDYWISGKYLNVFGDNRNTGGRDYYLEIYDLSKPVNPAPLGQWEGFDHVPEQVFYQDGIVYVAEGEDGLTIISPDNPATNDDAQSPKKP